MSQFSFISDENDNSINLAMIEKLHSVLNKDIKPICRPIIPPSRIKPLDQAPALTLRVPYSLTQPITSQRAR